MQGAGINIDRGGEEAIEAMKEVDAVLMIVGNGDVVPQLKIRVNKLQLNDRVIFFGKKPYDLMMNYTHYAEIGLTLDKSSNMNYKLSLPNKVFDYLQTETAIVATNIKEVARVVNKHKIGEILPSSDVEDLIICLNNLLKDHDRLEEYQSNCKHAAQTENWETEVTKLKHIYPIVEK